MTIDPRPVFEPTDERLDGIKAAARQRRARRRARYGAAGCTVAVLAAIPLVGSRVAEPPGRTLAVRQPDACHNSTRPECGPFHWEPAPAPNQPLRATVVSVDIAGGRTATVTVRWEDPDAARAEAPTVCWESPCPPPPEPCTQQDATGPWAAPPVVPGSGELRYTHVYSTPGSREVTIVVRSHAWPERSCAPGTGDPYSNTVTVATTLDVPGP
jgi:hypothetical protein